MDIPENYILANGPEGLEKVLNSLLEKTKTDPASITQEHFILYQLGGQKSLIKVDTSRVPFTFWYYDLLGRAATVAVKETIANFLWDKWGENDTH